MPNLIQFYFRERTTTYRCMDFAAEVWRELTGKDLTASLPTLFGPVPGRHARLSDAKAFERLERPISPCLVFMQQRGLEPHVGIYYDDRVLHLTAHGVEYQPLRIARRNYSRVRFYR